MASFHNIEDIDDLDLDLDFFDVVVSELNTGKKDVNINERDAIDGTPKSCDIKENLPDIGKESIRSVVKQSSTTPDQIDEKSNKPNLGLNKTEYILQLIQDASTSPVSNVFAADSLSTQRKHQLPVLISPITPKSSKVVYERKFPGPAGLFPKKSLISNELNLVTPSECSKNDDNNANNQVEICSQSSNLKFENGPWKNYLCDISATCEEMQNILNYYTLSLIKRISVSRHRSCRIPIFAAILHHIDCTMSDPSVILKDPSGEMPGTLHRDVWDQFSNHLVNGAVLLLHNVGILRLHNLRKPYLNITSYNIVAIYVVTEGSEHEQIIRVNPLPSYEEIRVLYDRWNNSNMNSESPIPSILNQSSIWEPDVNSSISSSNTFEVIKPPSDWISTSNCSKVATTPNFKFSDRISNKTTYQSSKEKNMSTNNNKSDLKFSTHSYNPVPNSRDNSPIPIPVTLSKRNTPFQPKKPHFNREVSNLVINTQDSQTYAVKTSSPKEIPVTSSKLNKEEEMLIVSSILEGIDTDSIFGDF